MSRRIASMEVMKSLQPLLQGGIITPEQAKDACISFVAGDSDKIKNICLNPEIPMAYNQVLENITDTDCKGGSIG